VDLESKRPYLESDGKVITNNADYLHRRLDRDSETIVKQVKMSSLRENHLEVVRKDLLNSAKRYVHMQIERIKEVLGVEYPVS
jgi:hypothetical protein